MSKEKLKAIVDQNKPHKIALIGMPYDLNSSYMRGSAEAPPDIRKALFSDSSNLWTETGADLGAALAAIRLVTNNPEIIQQLHSNVALLKKGLNQIG